MKELTVASGEKTIVDDKIYNFVSSLRWCLMRGHGGPYAHRKIKIPETNRYVNVFLHHIVVGRPLGGKVVDHINGNPLDNRMENLRIVSHRENDSNTRLLRADKKSSKYTGVSWQRGKWIATIQINGKPTYLGRFTDEHKASEAYRKKLKEIL